MTATFGRVPRRVTPGTGVDVSVRFGGAERGADRLVRVDVERTNYYGEAGAATIDGVPAVTFESDVDRTVTLVAGTTQTGGGRSGNLRLRAKLGRHTIGRSTPFSVSAAPSGMTEEFLRDIAIPNFGEDELYRPLGRYGFAVKKSFASDTSDELQLDQTQISECIDVTAKTGAFAGVRLSRAHYFRTVNERGATRPDSFTVDVARDEDQPGTIVTQQTHKYLDRRSGLRDEPVPGSGYLITQTLEAPQGRHGGLRLTTTSRPNAGTAEGIASTAGNGDPITRVHYPRGHALAFSNEERKA